MKKQILLTLIILFSTTQIFTFPRFTAGLITGIAITTFIKNGCENLPNVQIDGKNLPTWMSEKIDKNCNHEICKKIAKALKPQQKTLEETISDIVNTGCEIVTQGTVIVKDGVKTVINQVNPEQKPEQSKIDKEEEKK